MWKPERLGIVQRKCTTLTNLICHSQNYRLTSNMWHVARTSLSTHSPSICISIWLSGVSCHIYLPSPGIMVLQGQRNHSSLILNSASWALYILGSVSLQSDCVHSPREIPYLLQRWPQPIHLVSRWFNTSVSLSNWGYLVIYYPQYGAFVVPD